MKEQRGAALIIVLSFLSMSLMLGLSGIQSSLLDERLAGNYRATIQAQMAAETAVAAGWGPGGHGATAADFRTGLMRMELATFDWARFSALNGVSEDICSGNASCHYYLLREDDKRFIVGMGAIIDGDTVVAASQPVIAEVEYDSIPNPIFTRGLLSADYIWVTGRSTVLGGVHSNGTVDMTLNEGSDAIVTDGSNGMVEVPLPGTRPSDEDMSQCTRTEPPPYCFKRYDESIFAAYHSREGAIHSCSVTIGELQDGDTVYCDGDLTVSSGAVNDKRITLVARGNITMNGATSSAGTESNIGLFVVAGQDIEFNGSTNNFGVFWAGGYIRQNGNSSLYGAAVSGTYIRSNGGIDFISLDNVTNPDTFVPSSPRIVAWQ
ncbi:pilus assembly PilX family protein [Billgrantia pellis]|uniref:pilus assembly PilX family protein n=1 Tax=Billgrantia pellis TaxID=2606936 RepID=UPI0016592C50|nr:PilX N-terminal domain-containing pilus assembly protein [Halomonas pellis]